MARPTFSRPEWPSFLGHGCIVHGNSTLGYLKIDSFNATIGR